MNWSAAVLTGVTSDTEPTIVVAFDSAKYIFNVGENTNRAFLQSRQNWRKTRSVFLSSVGTQRASGLPGLLMSFADAGIGRLDVVGPSGLMHFLAAARSYTFRDTLAVHPTEVPAVSSAAQISEPVYSDENIVVYAATIVPTLDMERSPHTSQASLKRKRIPTPDSASKRVIQTLSATSDEPEPSWIRTMLCSKHFSPSLLEGEQAQEWRREIVREMFSGINSPHKHVRGRQRKFGILSGDTPKQTGKQAKAQVSGSKDTTSFSIESTGESRENFSPSNVWISVPAGFNKPLPKFNPPWPQCESATPGVTLAYAIVGPRLRGKFSEEKAKALGLPDGRIRGKLVRGQTVSFMVDDDNGNKVERVVRPEDCIAEGDGRGVLFILDTPTRSHIPSLVSHFKDSPFFSQYLPGAERSEASEKYAMRTVFHLCGEGVLEDDGYKAFMSEFGPDVHHLVASREHNADPVTFTSAAFNTLRLNQLDADVFPLPSYNLNPMKDLALVQGLPPNTSSMDGHVLVEFRPYRPPTRDKVASELDRFHPAVLSPGPVQLPSDTLNIFTEVKSRVQDALRHGNGHRSRAGDDVTIVPLGTGSAMPSKYRNVSSTLIQIPGWGNILLEAGEGTWGQLVRHFGPVGVLHELERLKCIFISHIHGDHHIGLAKILRMRRHLLPSPTEPLYLITHRAVLLYVYEYSDLEDLGVNGDLKCGVVPVLSESLHWKRTGIWQTDPENSVPIETLPWLNIEGSSRAASALRQTLGLERITTVEVSHRTKCFGIIFQHEEGWSIVFSADTMPSTLLVREGENATLLIHEATMADDQAELAHAKAHSTFGQAVEVARSMNAENVLLTHFSARYPKMPPSGTWQPPEVINRREPVLGLAFDQTRIKLCDMHKLGLYLPAIEQNFQDTKEEGDDDLDHGIAQTAEMDVDLLG